MTCQTSRRKTINRGGVIMSFNNSPEEEKDLLQYILDYEEERREMDELIEWAADKDRF